MLLAGCGSSSSSSSSSSSTPASTTGAAAAQLKSIRRVSSPANAAKATPKSLQKLPRIPKRSGPAAHIKGLSSQSLATQVSTLDGDLNQFWSRAFAAGKLQWPPAQEAIVQSAPVKTGCSDTPTIAPTDPPHLCNNIFFWTIPWLQQNIDPHGAVALAFTASILWSLHAEDVLGNSQALAQGQISKSQYGNQVMCFTGLWARTLSSRNLFEQGDSQAAAKFFGALQGVDNITAPDVTPQSLTAAFSAGYNSGSWSSCSLAGGGGGSGGGTSSTPGQTTT
jgi:predicted metalloprotease